MTRTFILTISLPKVFLLTNYTQGLTYSTKNFKIKIYLSKTPIPTNFFKIAKKKIQILCFIQIHKMKILNLSQIYLVYFLLILISLPNQNSGVLTKLQFYKLKINQTSFTKFTKIKPPTTFLSFYAEQKKYKYMKPNANPQKLFLNQVQYLLSITGFSEMSSIKQHTLPQIFPI